ncbi:hypothetical protein JOE21_003209 [Desmospora profundinema]|uniref:Uncharacterized protein n=1 Tax=Desmospora profundinema TaxID=1571184 RepID=A0ABU1IQY3_9BACL|nr:hypothetical protein [Desmospora profundinema]
MGHAQTTGEWLLEQSATDLGLSGEVISEQG